MARNDIVLLDSLLEKARPRLGTKHELSEIFEKNTTCPTKNWREDGLMVVMTEELTVSSFRLMAICRLILILTGWLNGIRSWI